MIVKLANLFVAAGLACLGLGGIFLAIGHSPDALIWNSQAEVSGNYAYGLLLLGIIFNLLSNLRISLKTKKR